MRTATFSTAAARATGDVATLYTHDPAGAVIRSPYWNEAPAYLGTGFLKASVDDLASYLNCLVAGEAPQLGVDAETFKELTTPRAWAAPGAGYALGWNVREHGALHVVRHGGSLKGIASAQGFVPELGLGMAVLTNVDDAPAARIWQAALNLAPGDDADKATFDDLPYRLLEGRSGASDELARLAGDYVSGEPWGRLSLRVEADGERPFSTRLEAYAGEDREPVGRVALLVDRGEGEFVLVSDVDGREAAWDAGRFHFDGNGLPVAVQHGLRWYDRL